MPRLKKNETTALITTQAHLQAAVRAVPRGATCREVAEAERLRMADQSAATAEARR